MMRNPYRKGTVHPTSSPFVSDHLSFLPAAIFTLTVALTPEDREVLAYLISSYTTYFSATATATATGVSTSSKNGTEHAACFDCNCFRCYLSYWAKWDSSPNRQLIHEIIDAFEEGFLVQTKKDRINRKERRTKNKGGSSSSTGSGHNKVKRSVPVSVEQSSTTGKDGGGKEYGDGDEEDFEKGSMRKFVGKLGEKIWSVLA